MTSKYVAEVYRDEAGEFRFRIKARNGKVIVVSSESYKRKSTMLRVLRRLLWYGSETEIVEL